MLVDSTRFIGWLSLALLALVIALPYFSVAASTKSPFAPMGIALPRSRRMSLHFWLAPGVALASILHAWIPMASHRMPRANFSGFWLATIAIGLILFQIGLGISLKYARRGTAKVIRRSHFFLMLAIAALILVHIFLNSPLLFGKN